MGKHNEINTVVLDEEKSYFDGGYFAYIGYNILVYFVTAITLGIAFPWMCCLLEKWKAKHTVICGKRMYFDGTGVQLIGKFLLWMLLTVITCGIYGFWMNLAVKKWVSKHTHFEGEEDNNSYFDGGVWGLIGTNILAGLVTVVPFVGFAWADVIKLRWETRHTVTDSRRLIFTGTVGNLFVKYLLWGFLTVITCGIFGLFMPIKRMRWETERIIDNEHTTEEIIRRSEYRTNVHTDAASFKTYHVENEMEGVKAGITNTMSENDLLSLANSGARSAQYEYVLRYADGQYTSEPFSSLLKAAADAAYAPAMCLYAQTHPLEPGVQRELLTKSAEKGQVYALKACLSTTAQEGLGLKEDKNALPTLKTAVRYADLLKESGEALTAEEETLVKKCVFAVRRIQSQQPVSSGGKIAAIVIAVLIGVPVLLGIILGVATLLPRFVGGGTAGPGGMMGRPMGIGGLAGNLLSGSTEQESGEEEDANAVSTADFWTNFSGELEANHSVITETGSSDGTTTYTVTCNYWYWSSECYISITDNDGNLEELRIWGKRVLDPESPDPTINQAEIVSNIRIAYKHLGLGDYDGITPYTDDVAYSEIHGDWRFSYDNTETEINVTVSK